MKKVLILFIIVCIPYLVFGQGKDDLEKKIQNPVASLISVPFQNNTNFNYGFYERTQNILNIQPVIPVQLSKGLNLITRTIAPIIWQPVGKDETTTGLGDINLSLFFTPANSGKVTWGLGPIFVLPTATDRVLGQGRWGAGPSFVILTQPTPWTFGILTNGVWSFAGQYDRNDYSSFLFQYFITLNLPNGWYVNSAPIISSSWSKVGDKWTTPNWTVPFGAGAGKLHRFGKLPVSISVAGFYNAVKPDYAPDWQLRAQMSFILPGF